MKGVWRFVDPDNYSVVRLDMNALGNGAATGFMLLGDVNLGTVETDSGWLTRPGKPGAVQVGVGHYQVEMSFKLAVIATSIDGINTLAAALQRECARGGVIEFKPTGQTESRYLEIYKSNIPPLYNGMDLALNKITQLFMNEAVEVTLWRHPYQTGPLLTARATGTLGNAVANRGLAINNPGNMPARMKITLTPVQAGSKLVEVKAGTKSYGAGLTMAGLGSNLAFEIEGATLSNDTASVAETGTSGGSVAETTFATKERWRRRWRKVFTEATAGSLKGKYRAFAIVRATGSGIYKLQLRYVNGNNDPAEETNKIVVFDAEDIQTYHYVAVDLGVVRLDDTSATFEGWAMRRIEPNSASGIRWDTLQLIPIDEDHFTVSVPGFKSDTASSRTKWFGDELTATVGTPTFKNDTAILNNTSETVRAPDQPDVLVAGSHHVKVDVELRNKDADNETNKRVRFGWFEVRTSADVLVERIPLRTRSNRETTRREKTITFSADGTTSYKFQVVFDNKPTNTEGRIIVRNMRWSFHRFANNTDKLVINGLTNPKKSILRANDAQDTARLVHDGDYPNAQPGDSLMVFSFGEMMGSGYDDVIEEESLSKHESARTVTATIDLQPRWNA